MKKFLLAALCAASAIYAGPFETWNGADGNPQVQTGLGNETETNGYWYTYEDYASFSCVTDAIDPPFITCTDATLDICKGFCGTARLHQGTSATKAFIGVGFNIVGETSTTNNTPAAGDASSWGGLCVTYTSDVDLQLELGLGDIVDSTISYANPAVTLPAAKSADILSPNGTNGNKVVVSWSDFKQPSWYDGAVKIDGETAVKQLVAIHFKLQADPGNYDFNICAVGPKDGTCPEKCGTSSTRIQIARGTSAVKAILNGRTLGFTGIKASATVEVMNTLGQVVMKNAINNASDNAATLNLASLDAGIYMVRVSGKNVNFAKKIVLR
ncbi:Por secretion system C-terminal sorting domain-containing protein [Fibrobacter sp. UWB16]|uniref:T9SS type A sorting domain-containing protein n=2 Tax=unclassified Fibrobacter TaxID=2634177 RepID=UPI000BD64D1D|nr:T9SS type A sorting domain-containing protein [Fibrobacter sp. UWB16]SOD14355.1 Por secretion system C-terminal sorting domain-containing protein [Fibrobacter sp. UWB16]